MNPVFGQFVIVGNHDLDAAAVDLRRYRRIHVFGDCLEPDPAAAVARQFPAANAEVEHFLHASGIEHRAGGADEHVIALMGQGRRLAGVVVSDHREHTAVARRAECVGMLEHVHAAIEPGSLAVPHAEHAIVPGAGKQAYLLAAPDRGHRQVFVNAG